MDTKKLIGWIIKVFELGVGLVLYIVAKTEMEENPWYRYDDPELPFVKVIGIALIIGAIVDIVIYIIRYKYVADHIKDIDRRGEPIKCIQCERCGLVIMQGNQKCPRCGNAMNFDMYDAYDMFDVKYAAYNRRMEKPAQGATYAGRTERASQSATYARRPAVSAYSHSQTTRSMVYADRNVRTASESRAVFCRRCGKRVDVKDAYCMNCGQKISE